MKLSQPFIFALVVVVALVLASRQAAAAAEKVEFNRDVRPVLSDTCFKCHGFDKNARKADLRLDVRAEAIAPRGDGGDAVTPIVPGDPARSDVWKRISSNDPDEQMPPPDSHLSLTDAQKDVLRRWIEQGAVYSPHWSFVPVQQPPVPDVRAKGWARNEID